MEVIFLVNDLSNYNIYTNKDGRMRAYNKETHAVISYPRLLVENKLGRKLLPGEDVHHIDENPLNNDLDNLEVISHSEHEKQHAYTNPCMQRKWFDKEMTCPVCNKTFIWTSRQQSSYYSRLNRGIFQNGPFCSLHCSGIFNAKHHTAEISVIEENKKVFCPICGKEFIQSRASQYRFYNDQNEIKEPCCSTSCYHAYRRLHKNN